MEKPERAIYMDHASTTAVDPRVVDAMLPYFTRKYGNPSSMHSVGRGAAGGLDEARRTVAGILGADRTVLISIMYANNEVGTIEPIADIGRIAHSKGIPFHTDAVQAGGALDLDVGRLEVDLLSLSAHKFYGPKGVGVLYVRQGTPLMPMQTGGGHERNRRAGTENVPYAVGLATALKLAHEHRATNRQRLAALRDRLVAGVLSAIPDAELTGHPADRLPNNASFVFDGVEGESILLSLDLAGVAASSGSACTTGEKQASHVLTATDMAAVYLAGLSRIYNYSHHVEWLLRGISCILKS